MQAKTPTPIADATTKLNEGVRETGSRFSSRMPILRGAALPDSSHFGASVLCSLAYRHGDASRRRCRLDHSRFAQWLAPAIPEAVVVLDLVEAGVAGAELVADALDRRPDIRAKAIIAASGDKAFAAEAVVDRAVGHKGADIRH